MDIDLGTVQVLHNEAASRFEATIDGHRSVLDYTRNQGQILFTHTGVPPVLRGQGVAGKLTHEALEYARANDLRVVPLCSYVATYIRRHPEYQSLVSK